MLALTAALADEFGTAKVFRPYRDVRFAKDKTPYKNHQGAFVAVGPATGWYVEIGSPGVRVGAGYYRATARTWRASEQPSTPSTPARSWRASCARWRSVASRCAGSS